jgi:hypothetical protein
MDASDRISFEDCPTCGGPAIWAWLDADPTEISCLDGCGLAVRPGQTPTFVVLVVLFEQAILDTAATYGLTDPRKAASLVADAWADVLREEGRPPRSVERATAAVRGIGDRMHRRQH